jgi:signal transduction histidine kinase
MGAFALVIGVAGAVAGAVAALAGPSVFHQHLVAAGLGDDMAALAHAEAAFRSASGTSLGIAAAGAVAVALALSVLITRRVSSVVGQLSGAARRVAGGRFDTRVASPHLGAEFDALADSFNEMGAALHASQQLRDRLLGDVAHELRTPVTTIAAYLEAIEDGVAALTPETVDVLRAQGERLTRLASDLAAVTRAQDGLVDLELVEANPAVLLEQAARAAAPAFAAKGVALQTVADAVPAVQVDPARFAQVLANLLENALRHTPSGGSVRLTAGAMDGAEDPAWVRIEVADQGEGIAAEHLDHIFERFYRVDQARDREHGGSGVGLAIAKAFTDAHGGRIRAASDGPGQGAVFTVELPPAI